MESSLIEIESRLIANDEGDNSIDNLSYVGFCKIELVIIR